MSPSTSISHSSIPIAIQSYVYSQTEYAQLIASADTQTLPPLVDNFVSTVATGYYWSVKQGNIDLDDTSTVVSTGRRSSILGFYPNVLVESEYLFALTVFYLDTNQGIHLYCSICSALLTYLYPIC